jgi:hypothetical protein
MANGCFDSDEIAQEEMYLRPARAREPFVAGGFDANGNHVGVQAVLLRHVSDRAARIVFFGMTLPTSAGLKSLKAAYMFGRAHSAHKSSARVFSLRGYSRNIKLSNRI